MTSATQLRERRTAYLMMAAAIAIGSFSFTIIKVLLRDLSPVTMAAGRVTFSALAFVAVVASQPRRRTPIARADRVRLVLCGFLGSAGFHVLFSWGQGHVSVAVAAVVLGTMPALVALGEALVLGHRLVRAQWIGVTLSTLGVVVISSGSGTGGWTLGGLLAMAGATVAWAAVTLLMRSLDGRYDEWWVNTPGTVLGALVMIAVASPSLHELGRLSAWSWVLLVWMGAVSSAFIYAAMGRATVALSGTTSASLSSLVTPASMVIAWLTLGERVGVRAAIGAIAVVAGVVAVSQRTSPPPVPDPDASVPLAGVASREDTP